MREKLFELLKGTPHVVIWDEAGKRIADHLIANGVTIPVRCKDCKYFVRDYRDMWCDYHTSNAADPRCDGACWVHEDDFCSYGERRTDNAND